MFIMNRLIFYISKDEKHPDEHPIRLIDLDIADLSVLEIVEKIKEVDENFVSLLKI